MHRRQMSNDFTGTAAQQLASCLSAYLFCLSGSASGGRWRGRRPGASPGAGAISGGRSGDPSDEWRRAERRRRHANSTKFKGFPRLRGAIGGCVLSIPAAASAQLPA
ncbi:hypothetical protein Bcep18194_C7574 [Burkholderia lata]|uniref:Uncharacterized protein n=1 Tax=Burkholderia lata (strain ATCC 17760 / DSM 23089 / LMG 22485 / NCIMB 9086 / R18194 / 383) TaxID=482957 RepID=Q39LP8_BURL3|nr:hypothetical protein Bcep18194_C7574 [Burkholderia lata]